MLCLPQCVSLIIINYAHASGPLALAIPTWRNSLVFHSVDKITSVFVHTLPALLLFCIRWCVPKPPQEPAVANLPSHTPIHTPWPLIRDRYPPAGFELPANLEFGRTMASGMLGYVCWQAFYLLHTEVFFRKQLNKQQELMTSIRWLTTPPYSGITLWVHRVVRACGILKPGEMFDSESWKTKMIFISVQLLYTAVTMLPVTWLWSSCYLHVWYLLIILLVCVWNGASYYIEVPADMTPTLLFCSGQPAPMFSHLSSAVTFAGLFACLPQAVRGRFKRKASRIPGSDGRAPEKFQTEYTACGCRVGSGHNKGGVIWLSRLGEMPNARLRAQFVATWPSSGQAAWPVVILPCYMNKSRS